MELAQVSTRIYGENEAREYRFTVGGRSNFLALPGEEKILENVGEIILCLTQLKTAPPETT